MSHTDVIDRAEAPARAPRAAERFLGRIFTSATAEMLTLMVMSAASSEHLPRTWGEVAVFAVKTVAPIALHEGFEEGVTSMGEIALRQSGRVARRLQALLTPIVGAGGEGDCIGGYCPA